MSEETKIPQGMPHAVLAEKRVISMLLNDPSLFHESVSLSEDLFHLPSTRIMLEVITEDHRKGRALDILLMAERLNQTGMLDAMGGMAEVASLYTYECSPTPEKFRRTLDLLREMAGRRMAIRTAWEMERVAREGEIAEVLGVTSEPITQLHELLTDTKPARDTKALLNDCADRFKELCLGETQAMGVSTSIEEINRLFLGLEPKRTIVISGYPGGGKSALTGQLAMDAALGGHHTLVCSLEMPAEMMTMRNIAYVARVPAALLVDPLGYSRETLGCASPPKHMLIAIKEATGKILASPYAIEDLTGANVHQIISCIRRAHRREPLKVVVVDFVQRIRSLPEMRRESQEQQYAHASHLLADLCKELGFTLLLGSQLNKDGAAKYAEAINEDADLHLQIVQDRGGKVSTLEHLGIAVVKDRHHGQGGGFLPLVLDGRTLRFIPKMPTKAA